MNIYSLKAESLYRRFQVQPCFSNAPARPWASLLRSTAGSTVLGSIVIVLASCGGGGSDGGGAFPIVPAASPQQEAPATYTIGGTVAGLEGASIVLKNNAGDDLVVTSDGRFSFTTPVVMGADYSVSVSSHALWQLCAVSNATGKVESEVSNVTITCSVALAQVTKLAGTGSPGSANGNGSAASFKLPFGLALDSSGNIYVSDWSNQLIRKVSPTRDVTTFAGSGQIGSDNGPALSATFSSPYSTAVDSIGNVYVADYANNQIRKISPASEVTTLAGSLTAGSSDGKGSAASFSNPTGVAVDANDNVYVADFENNLIRKINSLGEVTTLAGSGAAGSKDGVGADATFDGPVSVAVDARGNVYVGDYLNNMIRKITPSGSVTTLAGSRTEGSADGIGSAASFSNPAGVAVDANGSVYVADSGNHLIRRIGPTGIVRTLAGSAGQYGSVDGTGTSASFKTPFSLAIDGNGTIYVADTYNHLIRKITPTPSLELGKL
ncbi:NHL repeat-containing protein [Variovorax sp. M-6]|uniref:NHL repeat-containing protein n=1 Tax=Variovorax sp. M-6 TaxID=3233041 RepID=UPI003F973DD2